MKELNIRLNLSSSCCLIPLRKTHHTRLFSASLVKVDACTGEPAPEQTFPKVKYHLNTLNKAEDRVHSHVRLEVVVVVGDVITQRMSLFNKY